MSEMITEVDVRVGATVSFFDPKGVRHPALVTAVWGEPSLEARQAKTRAFFASAREAGAEWASEEDEQRSLDAHFVAPSLNVVYIDGDESKHDPYGRQIARSTSVPHRSGQPAHGYYWE